MNLLKHIKDKKGSYILEATMSLPVFIISVIAICLIIEIISVCESISFTTAKEVHELDINSYHIKVMTPIERVIVESNIKEASGRLTDFEVSKLKYLYKAHGIDDLIYLETKTNFSVLNPLGIKGQITFNEGILTRGFTGKYLDAKSLDAAEFEANTKSTKVVIFPKYGIRYHIPNCRYVNQNYRGESYHIDMEKEDAVRKGYTPCKVCLGGEDGENYQN